MKEKTETMINKGKRVDGRALDELRPIEAKAGILKNADGSGYFRLGNTIAIAGVYGPRKVHPRHMEKAETGILRTKYSMAPFSTTERIRPGPSRRSTNILALVWSMISSKILLVTSNNSSRLGSAFSQ